MMLTKEVVDAMTMLYYNILMYLAKVARRLARKPGHGMVGTISRIDNWSELLGGVKSSDDSCRRIMRIFDSVDYREEVNSIEKEIQDLREAVMKLHSHTERSKKPASSKPCFMVPFCREPDFVGRGDKIKDI